MSPRLRILIPVACLLIGIATSVVYLLDMKSLVGGWSFPLDDPWIHLQFARNLHDFGAFSYFKDQMVTSGSTSPLYTALLALGFFITQNEMVLSYALGGMFFLGGAFVLFQFMRDTMEASLWIAAAGMLFLLLDRRLLWVALSGMETTMFIFLLLLCLYAYKKKQGMVLGVAGGLLLWVRPDGVAFLIAMAIDHLYHSYFIEKKQRGSKNKGKKDGEKPQENDGLWLKRPAIIIALFGVAYAGFNLLLSGSPLPNTYAAKLKYYSGGGKSFPEEVFHFLTDGHLVILAIFAAVGILMVLQQIVRRKQSPQLVSLLWCGGMFIAYWYSLPRLYQEGRYMMPVLPFFFLLGISGFGFVQETLNRRFHSIKKRYIESSFSIIYLVMVAQFVNGAWKGKDVYADYCKYINDRQVTTGHWLHDHLPENSIVATHDVGAIAFYSERRIVDMVGLVSPEMTKYIGSYDQLNRFLVRNKVTHIAVLRNWFEVANRNSVFQTDERTPEIMEVFEFGVDGVQFIPYDVSQLTGVAAQYIGNGAIQQGGPLIERAIQAAPNSSRAHYWMGRALLAIMKPQEASGQFQTAVRLHPRYWDAMLGEAQARQLEGFPDSAITVLEKLMDENPSYAPGLSALANIYQESKDDSSKTTHYRNRYLELMKTGTK